MARSWQCCCDWRGRPSVLAILLLSGVGGMLWSREHPPPDTQTVRRDGPLRLLQWAVGLLPVDRVDWGHAMLGELDRIEGRSGRWRFALGCATGVVLLPPWGSDGPMALLVPSAGQRRRVGIGFVHFGLATNPWNWLMLVILAALVMSSLVAGSVLATPARCSQSGTGGGFFVTAAWLVVSGFTWQGIISPIYSVGAGPARQC